MTTFPERCFIDFQKGTNLVDIFQIYKLIYNLFYVFRFILYDFPNEKYKITFRKNYIYKYIYLLQMIPQKKTSEIEEKQNINVQT